MARFSLNIWILKGHHQNIVSLGDLAPQHCPQRGLVYTHLDDSVDLSNLSQPLCPLQNSFTLVPLTSAHIVYVAHLKD